MSPQKLRLLYVDAGLYLTSERFLIFYNNFVGGFHCHSTHGVLKNILTNNTNKLKGGTIQGLDFFYYQAQLGLNIPSQPLYIEL